MIDVRQGMTFSGWSPYAGFLTLLVGIVSLVLGIHGCSLAALAGLPLMFMGIVIFMNIQGTLIDPATKRCRVYRDFVLFKSGVWLDLSHFDRVTITHHRERFSHIIGRDMGTQAHIRTYFLSFKGSTIGIHLNEFEARNLALAMAERISAATGLPVEDLAKPKTPRGDRRR